MSDEGIEADPDESMNEWWWADWKSSAVKANVWGRESLRFFLISAFRKHRSFDALKTGKKKKQRCGLANMHRQSEDAHTGGGAVFISVEPPANLSTEM